MLLYPTSIAARKRGAAINTNLFCLPTLSAVDCVNMHIPVFSDLAPSMSGNLKFHACIWVLSVRVRLYIYQWELPDIRMKKNLAHSYFYVPMPAGSKRYPNLFIKARNLKSTWQLRQITE